MPESEPLQRGREGTEGPYILWHDYFTEGWIPLSFDTAAAAVRYGMEGGCGQPWLLTKRVTLCAVEEETT